MTDFRNVVQRLVDIGLVEPEPTKGQPSGPVRLVVEKLETEFQETPKTLLPIIVIGGKSRYDVIGKMVKGGLVSVADDITANAWRQAVSKEGGHSRLIKADLSATAPAGSLEPGWLIKWADGHRPMNAWEVISLLVNHGSVMTPAKGLILAGETMLHGKVEHRLAVATRDNRSLLTSVGIKAPGCLWVLPATHS